MENSHNHFKELVESRQSVRKFQTKSVDRILLQKCVESARLAPSAENVQPWRFLIIDDQEKKELLRQHAFSGIFRVTRWAVSAPVLVVILAKPDFIANKLGKQMTGIHYYFIDIGIAGEHFVLQAHDLGLGTCWIGWFNAKGVTKALNIPKIYQPLALLAVGYPAHQNKRERKRRPIEEICFYNSIEK